MVIISPTASEYKHERFDTVSLEAALFALHTDGAVIISNVVNKEHLDVLKERMEFDLKKIMDSPNIPHNFVYGNLQQHPPPYAEYVFRDIVANSFACQVTHEILGNNAYMNEISCNSCLPESHRQPVHVDEGHLWRSVSTLLPPARLAVNIGLSDVNEENGAVELWLGSHHFQHNVINGDIKVNDSVLNKRRENTPPVRGATHKGDILIRDMRLWHCGTPNYTGNTRFMLAMVHNISWIKRDNSGYYLETKGQQVFQNCPIKCLIPFVDEAKRDYLNLNRPYEYNQN